MSEYNFRYRQGSEVEAEAVDFGSYENGEFHVICTADVFLLLFGNAEFCREDGTVIKLSPQQQLDALCLIRDEREKITDGYPIKTLDGFRDSGFELFADFCFPGDKVDEAMVEDVVGGIKPSQNYAQDTMAVSFAIDSDGEPKDVFMTFHRISDSAWQFNGYCFRGQSVNQAHPEHSLNNLIASLQN